MCCLRNDDKSYIIIVTLNLVTYYCKYICHFLNIGIISYQTFSNFLILLYILIGME